MVTPIWDRSLRASAPSESSSGTPDDMASAIIPRGAMTIASQTSGGAHVRTAMDDAPEPEPEGDDPAFVSQELRLANLKLRRFRDRFMEMRRKLIWAGGDCPFCGRPVDSHSYSCPLMRD